MVLPWCGGEVGDVNDLFRLILQRPGMAEKYEKWKQSCPEHLKHLNVPERNAQRPKP